MVTINKLTRDYLNEHMHSFLLLEPYWTAIGDDAWTSGRMLEDLPKKWDMSHYAAQDDHIIGYQFGCMCAHPGHEDKAYLKKIVVDQSRRNSGAGRLLITSFLGSADSQGIERVRFRVRVDNPAVPFYDKLGFTRLPEIDNTRPDGVQSYMYEDNIKEMLKKLNDPSTRK